jgi:hypothetical protein
MMVAWQDTPAKPPHLGPGVDLPRQANELLTAAQFVDKWPGRPMDHAVGRESDHPRGLAERGDDIEADLPPGRN